MLQNKLLLFGIFAVMNGSEFFQHTLEPPKRRGLQNKGREILGLEAFYRIRRPLIRVLERFLLGVGTPRFPLS
jgi:hypothetical protein